MKVLQKEIQLWIIVEIMYKFFNGIRSYCSRLTFIQQAFLRSTIYSRNNLQTVRGSRCYATSSGMLNECINFTMCRFVFVMIYNCEINYQLIIICYLYLKTSYLLSTQLPFLVLDMWVFPARVRVEAMLFRIESLSY